MEISLYARTVRSGRADDYRPLLFSSIEASLQRTDLPIVRPDCLLPVRAVLKLVVVLLWLLLPLHHHHHRRRRHLPRPPPLLLQKVLIDHSSAFSSMPCHLHHVRQSTVVGVKPTRCSPSICFNRAACIVLRCVFCQTSVRSTFNIHTVQTRRCLYSRCPEKATQLPCQ